MTSIDRGAFKRWIAAYERAWRTAGTAPLAALFTDDATYSMQPYDEPAGGLAAIGALWERERDGHDEAFAMSHEVIAVDGDMGVARIEVRYARGEDFRDLWIVRFAADGRCRAFEEWPFWQTKGIEGNGDG